MYSFFFVALSMAVMTKALDLTLDSLPVSPDNLLDDTFRTLQWSGCDMKAEKPKYTAVSSGYTSLVSGETMYLKRLLENPNAPEGVPSAADIMDCMNYTKVSSNCTDIANRLVASGLCFMTRNKVFPTDVAGVLTNLSLRSTEYYSVEPNCTSMTPVELCPDGNVGIVKLCSALRVWSRSPRDIVVSSSCSKSNTSLRARVTYMSQQSTNQDRDGWFEVLLGNTSAIRHTCVHGVEVTCSRCVPYFQPGSNAQPYVFLLFSAVKGNVIEVMMLLISVFILRRKIRKLKQENKIVDPDSIHTAPKTEETKEEQESGKKWRKRLNKFQGYVATVQLYITGLTAIYTVIYFFLCVADG
eukprot:PhF_6_TR12984/c0_g1_i1/m.20531